MMVCAGMNSQPAIAGAVNNGCGVPGAGSNCDLPQTSQSQAAKADNPAHLHDRRQSPFCPHGLNDVDRSRRREYWDKRFKRRPSFPQGGLDWRLRRKVPQDGRGRQRRKTVSVCELPESDEDDEDGPSPDGALVHETSCPLFHTTHPTKESDRPFTDHTDARLRAEYNADNRRILAAEERINGDKDRPITSPLGDRLLPPSCLLRPPTGFPDTPQCSCAQKDAGPYRNNNNNNNEDQNNPGSRGIRRPRGGRGVRTRKRHRRETVILNVGGHVFETYRATVRRLRTPIFNCDDQLELYYRKSHGDYFFDRDPTAFGSILNFLRTGELHIPTNMCGPALQNELEFWGIEEVDIARCCWTQYNTWKTQCRSLEKLEYDRKFSTTQQVPDIDAESSCWIRYRSKIWTFLQDPGSSRKAKVYAWVSIIFVFVSIFSFCAETHPVFKVKAKDMTHFASFYEFLNLENIQWPKVIEELNDHGPSAPPNMTHPLANGTDAGTNSTSYNALTSDGGGGHVNSGDTGVDDGGDSDRIDRTGSDSHAPYGRGGIQKRCVRRCCNDNLHHYENAEDKPEGKDDDWGNKDLPHPALLMMDISCLIFFSLEYLTRFVCSPSKLNFLRALQNIVDFLAFAPDYVELVFLIIDPIQNEGMAIMEMLFILRILRLFRIFRLIRHVPGLWILLYTLKASFNELMLMCVFLLIGMVVFATLIHFVEPNGIFTNIPVGFWWSVVTMTTVGYGDMYPQSAAGYFIGSCCAVAGLLMIAFTVPIIVSNFVLYYTHVQYGLARKDREMERVKDEEDSDLARSRSVLDVEGAIAAAATIPALPILHQTTTRNGKSYTFLSNISETEAASPSELNAAGRVGAGEPDVCYSAMELKECVPPKTVHPATVILLEGQEIT